MSRPVWTSTRVLSRKPQLKRRTHGQIGAHSEQATRAANARQVSRKSTGSWIRQPVSASTLRQRWSS